MKVAFVLGSLNRGGAERLVFDLLQTVPENVEAILIHRKSGNMEQDFVGLGKDKFLLKRRSALDFVYFLRLRKLLKKEKTNIAHAQQFVDLLYLKLACIGLNIKLVQTIHGYDFKFSKLSKFLQKWSFYLADKSIFVSHSLKKYYEQKCKLREQKTEVVYNGLNFSLTRPVSESNLRAEFKIDKNAALYLSVGNFVKGRNQLFLCQFALELKRRGENFKLLLIGSFDGLDKGCYEECKQFCEKHELEEVVFTGQRADVQELLPQADAFLYASDYDSFGLAVIEAISAEIPCYINDWETMLEISENGKLADVYKTADTLSLLSKISERPANELLKSRAKVLREKFAIEKCWSTLSKKCYL